MAEPVRANAPESLEGAVIGRFSVLERLGEGGMGEVYRAQDTRLGRFVALKRMAPHLRSDPQYRQKFTKEAERASRFSDSHIAALYDILEENGELFLIMELVEGRNLRQRLREPMALRDFLQLAVECAQALAAAHARDILHCDIKPENIMITTSGAVKVLDFGVARRLAHPGSTAAASTAGVSGTTGYIAPEIVLERVPGATADILSLGVVFYEALAGFHPFHGAGFFDTCERILHAEPVTLDQIGDTPPALAAIVMRMIAKDPAQRYQSASEVIAALKAIDPGEVMLPTGAGRHPAALGTPTVQQGIAPAASHVPRLIARHRTAAAIAILVALVLLAAIAGRQTATRWVRKLTGAKPRQIAVLPFTANVSDPSEQAFAAGLAEAISSRLGGGSDDALQVVPAAELRAQQVDTVDKARQQFGVDLVLTGSLRQDGSLTRVSYSVVDARARRQVSGDTITVPAGVSFVL